MGNDRAVQTIGLTKVYRMGQQEVRALDGVNLEIRKGEFIAIVGRSGSGKSTLLNLIGCLDRPTRGTVLLDGADIGKLKDAELPRIRREKIGFIFQQYNLIPTLNALENVMLPLRYARVGASERHRRAQEALERVELGRRLKHRPSELSGGEQQRVAIARALINNPAIVLADEPTGEVDSQTAISIIRLMNSLNESMGQTFIIVTHDPMVSGEARRTIRLQDGHIDSDTGMTSKSAEGRG